MAVSSLKPARNKDERSGGKNNPKMKPRIKWGKFFVYLQVG